MFIRIILVIALVYGAYYVFYERKIDKQIEAAAPAFAQKIKIVEPDYIYNQLAAARGRVGILHVYKSNCILCKIYTPDLINMYKEYAKKGVTFIFVSLDEDKTKLAKFLAARDATFTPYMLAPGKEAMLEGTLKGLRIYYSDSLPFTALVDNSGNSASFSPSSSYKNRIEEKIKETLKRYETR